MSVIFEPKLEIPAGAVAPENYTQNSNHEPNDNFIVSRHRNGKTASIFGELTWNFSAYHPEIKPSHLNFKFWKEENPNQSQVRLAYETRRIIFSLIWLRIGNPLSIGTLSNYLSVINVIARYADEKSCTIQDLLADEQRIWLFIQAQTSGWFIQTLGSLLTQLSKIKTNFSIVGDKMLNAIRARGLLYRDTLNQHSPIPTRIYSEIIAKLLDEISGWEKICDELLSIVEMCGNNPLLGRSIEQQRRIAIKIDSEHLCLPTFNKLASDECLSYILSKAKGADVRFLSTVIAEMQLILKLTIQAFSGMRDDEATSLHYDCLEVVMNNEKPHYIIWGRTTKLNSGLAKRTRWVTSHDGFKAVKAAQKIAATIYSIYNIDISSQSYKSSYFPLFIGIGYLGFAGSKSTPSDGHFCASKIELSRMQNLKARIEPIIEDEDIRELEKIDPHRAWRSEEKFQIGQPWSFSSHQLRRSLALYAQRSGLVSLPSLRRQLQHITDEMSRYYARGSTFAKDFIGADKNHFGASWQETQPESEGLSYILNVLLSKDPLFGGHVSWIKHQLNGSESTLLLDRENTIRRFKKGEIAYKETLIGGCTNVNKCTKSALKWLNTDCLTNGCQNLVCNLNKLEKVIIAQENMIALLDEDSVEFRTEKSELESLLEFKNRAIKFSAGQ